MISQQQVTSKCLQIVKRRLNISEVGLSVFMISCLQISTVDVTAKYRSGDVRQETLIPKVPTFVVCWNYSIWYCSFIWDCSLPLFKCVKSGDNEIFRKSGSIKRMAEFHEKNNVIISYYNGIIVCCRICIFAVALSIVLALVH